MKPMSDEKDGKAVKPKKGKPINLYPLEPKEVLAALLKTPLPNDKPLIPEDDDAK